MLNPVVWMFLYGVMLFSVGWVIAHKLLADKSSKTDPYFSTDLGVGRLLEQYSLHKNLIVAFDFDDTIFDYHKKGFTYPKVVDLLLECQKLGFTLIMLTTTESDQHLVENVEYCAGLGLHVKYVNTGPVMPKAVKPFFNVYLDDKSGLGQAYEMLHTTIQRIKQDDKTL